MIVKYFKHFKLKVHTNTSVSQSCPTLCDPMDYSLPGFSAHGILQARILEWVAIFKSHVSDLVMHQILNAVILMAKS